LKKLIKRNSERYRNIQVLGTLKLPLVLVGLKKGARFKVNHSSNKKSLDIKCTTRPKVIQKISQVMLPHKNIDKSVWVKNLKAILGNPVGSEKDKCAAIRIEMLLNSDDVKSKCLFYHLHFTSLVYQSLLA
jgi:hypothetical protein